MPPKIVQSVAIFIPILGPGFAVPPTRVLQPKPEAPLSDYEKMTLEACRSSVRMFRGNPSAVWPGYNLAEQTFLVYIPEKWVLLFNPPERIEGFEACPEGWPEFGTKVLYHEGLYGDLIGELAFDFEIGGIKTVAIGPGRRSRIRLPSPFFAKTWGRRNFGGGACHPGKRDLWL